MAPQQRPPRVLVVGDLMLDVVLAPARPLQPGTDVPGRVWLRQGGSAANTARWLARLGARSTLVSAVGGDRVGRALVESVRRAGVRVQVARNAGSSTGRIGVLVGPGGERSFVADRGAADLLRPVDLKPSWFRNLDCLHMPAYSLLGDPLGQAGQRAITLAQAAGVPLSLDLASIGPLLAGGRRHAASLIRDTRPDLLFATAAEAHALLGRGRSLEDLLAFAPAALVKRGPEGAVVLVAHDGDRRRFEVAAAPIQAGDTTGAGDAFDAGALLVWAAAASADRTQSVLLRRAAVSGQRAATRHLKSPQPELVLR